jgi:hypothetical protein
MVSVQVDESTEQCRPANLIPIRELASTALEVRHVK